MAVFSVRVRPSSLALAALGGLALSGCSDSTFLKRSSMGSVETLATSGELRLVTSSPGEHQGGRMRPSQVVCAEPSPDVAKIAAQAFGAGGTLDLGLRGSQAPAESDLKSTLALSASRAEALAQLTQRLATIQLLRDGLYRACEAYANGAISDTTYAVLLSRFDDTMITMLTSELVAENFGHRLAALGTSADASSAASMLAAEGASDVQGKREALATKLADRDRAERELKEKRAEYDAAQAPGSGKTAEEIAAAKAAADEKQTELEKARRAVDAATAALDAAGNAAARSSAGTSHLVAGGGGSGGQAGQNAHVIGEIQSRYINSINADALMVACITSMDRAASVTPEFEEAVTTYAGWRERAKQTGSKDDLAKRDKAYAHVLATASGFRMSAFAIACHTSILPTLKDLAKTKVDALAETEKSNLTLHDAAARLSTAHSEIERLRQLLTNGTGSRGTGSQDTGSQDTGSQDTGGQQTGN